jgi:hypothetical protein
MAQSSKSKRNHGTYCEFDRKGIHILANYHGDHVYLFNVESEIEEPPKVVFDTANLPGKARGELLQGNSLYKAGNFIQSVNHYSAAIFHSKNW